MLLNLTYRRRFGYCCATIHRLRLVLTSAPLQRLQQRLQRDLWSIVSALSSIISSVMCALSSVLSEFPPSTQARSAVHSSRHVGPQCVATSLSGPPTWHELLRTLHAHLLRPILEPPLLLWPRAGPNSSMTRRSEVGGAATHHWDPLEDLTA
jgi:hypothetical protein